MSQRYRLNQDALQARLFWLRQRQGCASLSGVSCAQLIIGIGATLCDFAHLVTRVVLSQR
jgi:hypothetical protein